MKASRAILIASLTSATLSSGIVAILSVEAGSWTSKVFPSLAWTNWPFMKAASRNSEGSLSYI